MRLTLGFVIFLFDNFAACVSGLLPGRVRILAGKMSTCAYLCLLMPTCAPETCQPQRHFGALKTLKKTGRLRNKDEVTENAAHRMLRWDNQLHLHRLAATFVLENHKATLTKCRRFFEGCGTLFQDPRGNKRRLVQNCSQFRSLKSTASQD